MKKIIVGLVLSALALVGCAENITSGIVVEKDYIPPYHTTVCNQIDKTMVCTPINRQECYKVVIQDSSGGKGSWCVSPHRYEQVKVGSKFEWTSED